MKFAVIGLGSFGTKRAQSIKNSKLASLVAVNDTNQENAQKASKLLSVPILTYDQILKDKNVRKKISGSRSYWRSLKF